MMRLNALTNKPFNKGDVREDGYIFQRYLPYRPLRRDGTFVEQWIAPNVLAKTKALRRTKRGQRESDKKLMQRRRRFSDAVKSATGCMVCGFNEHPCALDYDHRDEKTKLFNIGTNIACRSWDSVVAEILKCDILCANCHRLKSNGLLDVTDEQRRNGLSAEDLLEIAVREKASNVAAKHACARRRAALESGRSLAGRVRAVSAEPNERA